MDGDDPLFVDGHGLTKVATEVVDVDPSRPIGEVVSELRERRYLVRIEIPLRQTEAQTDG